METIEYRTIDKGEWGDGPWQSEPDKKQWVDQTTGLACLIVRPWGALCGYVGVPPGHPAFGKGYDNVEVEVHGGLTFAGECHEGPEESAICHKPAPGESDRVWWLGFDCAHAFDLVPSRQRGKCFGDEKYRDWQYVEDQVASLAAQLAAYKG